MKVLIACEESQAVCKEFRLLGHEAYSCDIKDCSGNHPEWHIKDDVLKIINDGWDMMIAHPPCTYLAVSGAQWYYDPKDKSKPHPKYPDRAKHREDAVKFFINLWEAPINKIVIENPIGIMSTRLQKPTQIVQPYYFGDSATKTTCLWIKGLPNLLPTKIVEKGQRKIFKSGKSMPLWYADAFNKAKTPQERQTLRSKTFPGMAKAMAQQWTKI